MALFSARDRIAIAVICLVILAGWGVRLFLRGDRPDDLRVIRNAVEVPAPLAASPDSTINVRPGAIADAQADSVTVTKIDLNRATAADLEKLPGIGPVKARAIVEYRIRNGPFSSPGDIVNVTGIGPKTYERIAPFIMTGKSE